MQQSCSTVVSGNRHHQEAPSRSQPFNLSQEAPLFSSAPNLCIYPASAALASTSQAMNQLLASGQGTASSSCHASGTNGPYATSGLLQKDTVGIGHGLPAQYQHQFSAHPYITSTTRSNAPTAATSSDPGNSTSTPICEQHW
ncbi:hypothetical protein AAFF_G00298740 [Aldrovandia affinis]|uniref:Uncharacterized protein n=1 Tax=Aldrovandia affinis TaxID=143900 RepID=A0AAD7R9E2_9TELE|nr:hypothetical protein AAFF_G00298740 [Aldrovandia affinis]